MTVAFSDVNLVCDMLRPLPSFANFVATNSATADFYVARKPLSATINTLANALYKVREGTCLRLPPVAFVCIAVDCARQGGRH